MSKLAPASVMPFRFTAKTSVTPRRTSACAHVDVAVSVDRRIGDLIEAPGERVEDDHYVLTTVAILVELPSYVNASDATIVPDAPPVL